MPTEDFLSKVTLTVNLTSKVIREKTKEDPAGRGQKKFK